MSEATIQPANADSVVVSTQLRLRGNYTKLEGSTAVVANADRCRTQAASFEFSGSACFRKVLVVNHGKIWVYSNIGE